MKTIIYLIQVSACTGIFYLFYYLVLRRLTFFTINRWYLLSTLFISFFIPAITVSEKVIPQNYRVSPVSFSNISEVYVSNAATMGTRAVNMDNPFDWLSLLPALYFSIAGILAVYFLITMLILLMQVHRSKFSKEGKIKLLKGDKRYKNGSFFNYIFINEEELSPSELEQIIAHELIHMKQRHSIDKVISRLSQIALWFNPFVYAYYNAIDANHEYEVDQEVAQNSDKEVYAQLILRLVASGDGPLYHHFSKFPLSRRIALLFKKPTRNMKKIIYASVIPLLIICVFACANRKSELYSNNDPKPLNQRISAIDGLEKLGKNPLVIIDGKNYDSDILYKISPSGLKGSTVYLKDGAMKQFGAKAVDGAVKLTTKNGNITYLTALDKENLQKKESLKKGFYNRISLAKEDGTVYDEVRVNFPGGGMLSSSLKKGQKAGFLIGNKVYDESQIKEVEEIVKDKPMGAAGVGGPSAFPVKGLDLSSYDLIFHFDTKGYVPNTGDSNGSLLNKNSNQGMQVSVLKLTGIGKNPLVVVDGKEYGPEILYTISKDCIRKSYTVPAEIAIRKYGEKAKDGYVEISTDGNKIVYMTALERENLIKQIGESSDQFYTRLVLKKDDGSLFDRIVFHIPGLAVSHIRDNYDVAHDTPIGFMINDKLLDEKEFVKMDKSEFNGIKTVTVSDNSGKASPYKILVRLH